MCVYSIYVYTYTVHIYICGVTRPPTTTNVHNKQGSSDRQAMQCDERLAPDSSRPPKKRISFVQKSGGWWSWLCGQVGFVEQNCMHTSAPLSACWCLGKSTKFKSKPHCGGYPFAICVMMLVSWSLGCTMAARPPSFHGTALQNLSPNHHCKISSLLQNQKESCLDWKRMLWMCHTNSRSVGRPSIALPRCEVLEGMYARQDMWMYNTCSQKRILAPSCFWQWGRKMLLQVPYQQRSVRKIQTRRKSSKKIAFWHGTLFKLQARQKIETSEHKKEKQESQQSNSTTNWCSSFYSCVTVYFTGCRECSHIRMTAL